MLTSAITRNQALQATVIAQQQFVALWARAVRPAWIVVGACGFALSVLCLVTPFEYATCFETMTRFSVVASLLIMAGHFAGKEWPRTALALQAMALLIATILTMPPLASIFASAALPYQDATLVQIDRSLGIDWVAIAFWFRDQPALSTALSHIYVSIEWQPALLVAALAFADPERLRRMLSASALTLAVTIVSYMLLPAIGPYEYFHFEAGSFPDVLAPGAWVAPGITEALRQGWTQTSFEGLVTFPSFHAVTAVLFAYGWLGVPLIGRAFFIWNMAMLVSCVPIGSHYVIDVIVGIALALAGLHLSDRYFRATDTERPLPHWTQTQEGQKLLALSGGVSLAGLLGISLALTRPVAPRAL